MAQTPSNFWTFSTVLDCCAQNLLSSKLLLLQSLKKGEAGQVQVAGEQALGHEPGLRAGRQ